MKPDFSLNLNDRPTKDSEWTYWHQHCAVCDTGHYTFDFAQTVEHAKLYHQDSTWADDKTFA